MLSEVRKRLYALENPSRAKLMLKFFQTHPGGYGEGDQFLGLTVPQVRTVAKFGKELKHADTLKLLKSKFHEERLLALFIFIDQFKRGNQNAQAQIYTSYLKNTGKVNGWDLVDASAHFIVGPYLENRPRAILYKLARSKSLWDRRIAVVSTFHYIRQNDYQDIIKLSAMLLKDDQDLMHKAVGWMLREMGKRDISKLRKFLDKHSSQMPRTMLRYSIEKLGPTERRRYMNT